MCIYSYMYDGLFFCILHWDDLIDAADFYCGNIVNLEDCLQNRQQSLYRNLPTGVNIYLSPYFGVNDVVNVQYICKGGDHLFDIGIFKVKGNFLLAFYGFARLLGFGR